MTLAFAVAVRIKKNSVADVAWGLGFIVSAAVGLIYTNTCASRQLLGLTLVILWGLRLAVHIYFRNKGKGEDYRYTDMAEKGGSGLLKTYRSVFLSQGALLLIVGLPLTVLNATPVQSGLNLLDYIGTAIWIVGFIFEALGDLQLLQFIRIKDNKGKILMSGVWNYSRHPNYFGELTQWWGLGLIALNVSYGWVGLIGPIAITYLIVFVSGVPLLEKHYDGNTAYEAYRKRTSILVPLPPRKV